MAGFANFHLLWKRAAIVLALLLPAVVFASEPEQALSVWSDASVPAKKLAKYQQLGTAPHYFLSDGDTFFIDLSAAVVTNAVADTFSVKIGDQVFDPGLPGPVFVTGLSHSEWKIFLRHVDNSGSNILPPQQRSKYSFKVLTKEPVFTNDAVVLGLLFLLLGFVFYTSSSQHSGWKKFYRIIPMLLLCYFLPSLLNTFGLVSGEISKLYYVASRYFLPASLVLLTLSIDLREIAKLGPKALIMFGTATVGVIAGGPLAVMIVSSFAPEVVGGVGPNEVWRGLATVAGSWIGGGANQAAMYEIFEPSESLYSVMITVDIIVAEVWMFFLLLGVGQSDKLDKWFKADTSSIETLRKKMETFSLSIARIPTTTNIMVIVGICLAAVGFSHFMADILSPFFGDLAKEAKQLTALAMKEGREPEFHIGTVVERMSLTSGFFWLIVTATTVGLVLSLTKARSLEGAGASKIGTIFIYFLVATIGMKMDIMAIFSNPGAFMVGGIWMAFHVGLLFLVGKLIKAPYFFLAVGSKANIGGAASAPVVAGAFHPSLAPVGVLLAVLGYALGTYGAWLCGLLMQGVSP